MRNLEVVMNTRNKLREEMQKYQDLKKEMYQFGYKYIDMSNLDKQKYAYLTGTIQRLELQINTLEFVLNEDSILKDSTTVSVSYPFTKEELFKNDKSCKCNCTECNVGIKFL